MNREELTAKNIVWITDPGHGWLRIPKEELKGFTPSPYSYEGQGHVYLEEDCDAPGWLRHVSLLPEAARGLPEQYSDGDSFVRRLTSCSTAW